jgi:phospholipid-binding lipoprotein MlaA
MSRILALAMLSLLCACASNPDKDDISAYDPYEETNRTFYDFNDTLDRNFLKPLSEAYADNVPSTARTGVTNFFSNLSYLNVILHDLLQGNLTQFGMDTMRFVVNSSVGVGGLMDVATPMGLPEHEEDFGQTLAVWGFEQGAYLNLPLFGPNTIRNTPDYASSTLANPFTYVGGVFLFPVTALNIINTRANLLEASDLRDEAAVDPYTFTREAYLQRRQFLIHNGNPPLDEEFDMLLEESDSEDGVLYVE